MIRSVFSHAIPVLAALAMTCATAVALAQVPPNDQPLPSARATSEQELVEDLIRRLQGPGGPATPDARAPAMETALPAPAERRAMPRPMGSFLAPRRGGEPLAAPIPDTIAGPSPSAAPPSPAPPVAAADPPPLSPTPPLPAPLTPTQIERIDALPSINVEVHFFIDSARLTNRAFATLAILGRALSDERLAGQVFLIAGHTDASGAYAHNVTLSERRAEAVRAFLIENFAIAPERLLARGFGPDRLRNPANPLSRLNRRVQIVNWTSEAAPGTEQRAPVLPQQR